MKRNLLFAAIALAGVSQANATCFVNEKASGKNDGSSWTDAFVDLQDSVNSTVCSEIWVAEGVYKPSATGDDTANFNVKPDVKLYGGFAGVESSLADRNLSLHKSVLSGDIDNNDSHAGGDEIDQTAGDVSGDNSQSLINLSGEGGSPPISSDTVVDGFTLTGASMRALLCDGEFGGECSPTLRNLTFIGNGGVGGSGAAIFFAADDSGVSRPTISDSVFKGNASYDGGAMFASANDGGIFTLALNNVVFDSNIAIHNAGAIYVDANYDGGNDAIEIKNSRFTGNSADWVGGAIYTRIRMSGSLVLDIADSTFDSNAAYAAGAIYGIGNSAQFVTIAANSTFENNSAVYDAGALSLNNMSSPTSGMHTFNNVTFHANQASGNAMVEGTGGAISLYNDSALHAVGLTMKNSIMWADSATSPADGPEIYNYSGISEVDIDSSVVAGSCPIAASCTRTSSADPLLGPFGFYFGITPVLRPGIGGSAIDNGDDATCEATDQRGFARPQGSHCDIGAVEFRLPSDDIVYDDGFE